MVCSGTPAPSDAQQNVRWFLAEASRATIYVEVSYNVTAGPFVATCSVLNLCATGKSASEALSNMGLLIGDWLVVHAGRLHAIADAAWMQRS